MVHSVVVAFDGSGLVLANATTRLPDMRARVLLERFRDGVLDTTLELVRAGPATARIVQGLAARYLVTIVPEENGPDCWRGRVVYLSPGQLQGHPVYDALLRLAPDAHGAGVYFEDGYGLLRLDSDNAVQGPEIKDALHAWGHVGRYCIEEHKGLPALRDWEPWGLASRMLPQTPSRRTG